MEFSAPIAVALAETPGLSALSDIFARPDPQTAWLLALGFLGIVGVLDEFFSNLRRRVTRGAA